MAALQHKQRFVLNVCSCVLLFSYCARVEGQNDQQGRYYSHRDNTPYEQPNPGDRDYKTIMFNNRRYGLPFPNYYHGRGVHMDPTRTGGVPPIDRYPYDLVRIPPR